MNKKSTPIASSLGLLSMGKLGEIALRVVAANLQAVLEIAVDTLEPRDIPQNAYQDHRQQFDAGLIIKHLTELPYPNHLKILAVTNVDLCIPILTYVFGEAEMGGRAAVISGFRLRHNDDGSAVPLDRYYERLAKVALHEVAHTFSLYHCENPSCLMQFSANVQQLDHFGILFCDRCAFMLRRSLHQAALQHCATGHKSFTS